MADQIYQKIIDIMAEIGAIGKDRENKAQGFKFRGVDDVYNRLHPLLVRHEVFSSSEILDTSREAHVTSNGKTLHYAIVKMRYTFCTVDGSCVNVETVGEGMDSGDKASNKAMSAAHKYAMFQLFSIPTELHDSDRDTHDINARLTPADLRQKWGDKQPKDKRTFGAWRDFVAEIIGRRLENPDDESEWQAADIVLVWNHVSTIRSGDTVPGDVLDAITGTLEPQAEAMAAGLDAVDNALSPAKPPEGYVENSEGDLVDADGQLF